MIKLAHPGLFIHAERYVDRLFTHLRQLFELELVGHAPNSAQSRQIGIMHHYWHMVFGTAYLNL